MFIPFVDMKLTGRNISVLRERRGISVRDLQDLLGFSTPQSIYKWQRGETLPTVDNLAVLSALFGVKIDDILVFQEDGGAAVSA